MSRYFNAFIDPPNTLRIFAGVNLFAIIGGVISYYTKAPTWTTLVWCLAIILLSPFWTSWRFTKSQGLFLNSGDTHWNRIASGLRLLATATSIYAVVYICVVIVQKSMWHGAAMDGGHDSSIYLYTAALVILPVFVFLLGYYFVQRSEKHEKLDRR